MTDDVIRLHFLSDVRELDDVDDHGAAYECRRCGHVTGTKVEMWEHRKGLISPCDVARVRQWLQEKRNQ